MNDLELYHHLKSQIKEKEEKIIELRRRAKIHRNDKYKQKKRVDDFFKNKGISADKLRIEHAKLLIKLNSDGVISVTNKQIAEACCITYQSVCRIKSNEN